MVIIAIALAAFLATLAGGFFALKHRDKLHLITGFSAGAIITVALADLLPEAVELKNAHGIFSVVPMVLLGYLAYFLLDGMFKLRDP